MAGATQQGIDGVADGTVGQFQTAGPETLQTGRTTGTHGTAENLVRSHERGPQRVMCCSVDSEIKEVFQSCLDWSA
jgi:hypothetical protein